MPTLPAFPAGSVLTSGQLTQLITWQQFWANPPMFRMYQTAVQPIPNGADTQVTMDTSKYDTDSGRAIATPWSYTIPVGMTGRWQFTVCIAFSANATGSRQAKIFQNGALIPDGSHASPQAGPATADTSVTITVTDAFNAGDVIAAYGWQNSGAALNTNTTAGLCSFFEGRMVSLANP